MNTRPILMSLCVAMALSACSTAKKSSYNTHIFSNVSASTILDKAQMQIYIASAESQLLALELLETNRCISGQLAIAQSYLTRAIAEHNTEMEKDAFITLVDFDRQIRKIHCINQYINGQLGCGHSNKKVVLKRWYDEGEFNQCENKPTSILQETKHKEINKKHLVITETLHDFNEDKIKSIYYPSLNKLIELIKSYPNSRLLITGHTDSKGSQMYNSQLGKRRAKSVENYFTENGIEASKIVIKSEGEANIREVEKNNVSRVFNRYTSITLVLDTNGKKDI